MFAVIFDLVVMDVEQHHPKNGLVAAYAEIVVVLAQYGFRRAQGGLYVSDDENLANLFSAIQTLRTRSWFPESVRNLRAFRIEQWSDFTFVAKNIKADSRRSKRFADLPPSPQFAVRGRQPIHHQKSPAHVDDALEVC